MIYLVTGGRGFIGSHFVEKVLADNHEVIDIDKMTYAASNSLPWDNNPNYKHIKKDICELKHLPCCDIIVNFAAESHVDNSIESPGVFLKSNTEGVFNLLNLIKNKTYEKPTLVHISTDEVYGEVALDEEEKTEESILNPGNPYSASKAAAEMFIFSYAKTHDINYHIVRSANNYGPRQFPEKLIPKIIKHLKTNKKIPIQGDGSNIRDWLYVEDNAEAIYKITQYNGKNEIWNVSAYNYLKNTDVVKTICMWMGIENYEQHIEYVENRLGHDYRYSICSEKIRQKLKWKPEHDSLTNFLET
jgi:dTDP-glucose 4,6-dehydratase